MPHRKWKRPILLLLSIIGLIGAGALFIVYENPSTSNKFTIVLALACGLLLLLGLVVSIIGCDKCVARIFGDI